MSAANALLDKADAARTNFFKHLLGLNEQQWDFKLTPQCSSIRETLIHLLLVDRITLQCMQTNSQPDWDQQVVAEEEKAAQPQQLLQLVEQSHKALSQYMHQCFANTHAEDEVVFWGEKTSLAEMCISLTGHDAYHTGQASLLRQASDSEWDYYAAIYG